MLADTTTSQIAEVVCLVLEWRLQAAANQTVGREVEEGMRGVLATLLATTD